MKIVLVLLLCLLVVGWGKKPIDEIFIEGRLVSIFDKESVIGWHKAQVYEKRGNMWKIEIKNKIYWIDITDEEINWKKANLKIK